MLRELPPDEPITGLGFSDDRCYARLLESRFAYLNTGLDAAPVLDITKDGDVARYMPVDFVICSDVLERVAPPVDRAFRNLASLLRPGGLLVFSVPSFDMPETVEHYPRFHDARIVEIGGERVLLNRTAEGELETFRNLVFHGGAGSTLEMRLFAENDVVSRLKNAGFDRIRDLDTPVLPVGSYRPQAPGQARDGFEPRGYIVSARRMN